MKYALVTGASRGIGRAIAIELAKDGYFVVLNYSSNHEAAKETLRIIQQNCGQAELLPFDVSDPDAINAALDRWFAAHPDDYIDVLVNNAGVVHLDLMLTMDTQQWHGMIDTNLNQLFYVTRRVAEGMVVNHHGRIINIASLAGIMGFSGMTGYSAAKSALIGATRSLAVELAPKKITVNAVAPGLIDTDMVAAQSQVDPSQRIVVPMGRMGKPEEVAYLVSFLASEKASYISGQTISINGAAL